MSGRNWSGKDYLGGISLNPLCHSHPIPSTTPLPIPPFTVSTRHAHTLAEHPIKARHCSVSSAILFLLGNSGRKEVPPRSRLCCCLVSRLLLAGRYVGRLVLLAADHYVPASPNWFYKRMTAEVWINDKVVACACRDTKLFLLRF